MPTRISSINTQAFVHPGGLSLVRGLCSRTPKPKKSPKAMLSSPQPREAAQEPHHNSNGASLGLHAGRVCTNEFNPGNDRP